MQQAQTATKAAPAEAGTGSAATAVGAAVDSVLSRGLNVRHIRFMALGSAIGTGLFYGSASAIQKAGPAVLLAYMIGGAAVFMVMRALGEMAVRHPVSGSFGQYASRYLGPLAGFVTGWTYVFEMAIVAIADVTAFSIYMGFWFPQVDRWIWVLAVISVPVRVLLFYVLTLGVLMSLFPWDQVGSDGSPFVQIFSGLGIPAAPHILNAVVITAALSAINSDIFGAGRILFGLAKQGHAPQSFGRVSRHGVPWMTVVMMAGILLVGVVLNAVIPEDVFLLIASIATFATVWVWVMILASHVAMKREIARKGLPASEFPSPWWPAASILTIAFMALVIAVLGAFEDTRIALYVGAVWLGLLVLAYRLWIKGDGRRRAYLEDETSPLPVVGGSSR